MAELAIARTLIEGLDDDSLAAGEAALQQNDDLSALDAEHEAAIPS